MDLLGYPHLAEARLSVLPALSDLGPLFDPDETQYLETILAAEQRRDWLAGRLAAKTLLRSYFFRRYGLALKYRDILLHNTENGVPFFMLPQVAGGKSLANRFNITLAHSHGRGLAALAETAVDGWVGVDLEHIVPRSSGLPQRILTGQERACFDAAPIPEKDQLLLVYWCLKEAAMKAMQAGIRVGFQSIAVELRGSRPGDGGQATIHFSGEADRYQRERGGGDTWARYTVRDGFSYALVMMGSAAP